MGHGAGEHRKEAWVNVGMCGLLGAIAFHFTPAWVFWGVVVITALLLAFLGFCEIAAYRRERWNEYHNPVNRGDVGEHDGQLRP